MMRLFFIFLLLLSILPVPVSAVDFTAPQVPASGSRCMPDNTEDFGSGLLELLQTAVLQIRPDLNEAANVMLSVTAAVVLICILRFFTSNVKNTADMTGAIIISAILFTNTDAMIHLATETVLELSEYGKLFFPVMTAAVAAQGGLTSSTALYVGTTIFDSILGSIISGIMVPLIYLYLALAAAASAMQEDGLKKIQDLIKNFVSWSLKILLTVYTTYMSITGVVSGTTDAAALKATQVTIASVVPVVGGILSDASEAILVSTGLMKNAAGIYGILAALAIFLEPFLKIGIQYVILKVTSALCGLFGSKNMVSLIEDFSSAMGLLLAMTGAVCLLLLISTICFMRGVG